MEESDCEKERSRCTEDNCEETKEELQGKGGSGGRWLRVRKGGMEDNYYGMSWLRNEGGLLGKGGSGGGWLSIRKGVWRITVWNDREMKEDYWGKEEVEEGDWGKEKLRETEEESWMRVGDWDGYKEEKSNDSVESWDTYTLEELEVLDNDREKPSESEESWDA